MSSSSASKASGSFIQKKPERGFSKRRFQDFLNRGNQLANPLATQGSTTKKKGIEGFVPKEIVLPKGQFGIVAREAKRRADPTNVIFDELTTGVTQEQVDALTNSFLQRQRSIQQRRAQPGRSALFLSR